MTSILKGTEVEQAHLGSALKCLTFPPGHLEAQTRLPLLSNTSECSFLFILFLTLDFFFLRQHKEFTEKN